MILSLSLLPVWTYLGLQAAAIVKAVRWHEPRYKQVLAGCWSAASGAWTLSSCAYVLCRYG